EELDLALSAAEAGLFLLFPHLTEAVSAGRPCNTDSLKEAGDELEEIKTREKEGLRLLGGGLGEKKISARLDISEHTAKFHISSILGKMSVASRTEAVSQGISRGLIPI